LIIDFPSPVDPVDPAVTNDSLMSPSLWRLGASSCCGNSLASPGWLYYRLQFIGCSRTWQQERLMFELVLAAGKKRGNNPNVDGCFQLITTNIGHPMAYL